MNIIYEEIDKVNDIKTDLIQEYDFKLKPLILLFNNNCLENYIAVRPAMRLSHNPIMLDCTLPRPSNKICLTDPNRPV